MKPGTIIDPDKDTPRTDAVAKMIGRLACQLKTGELELHAFAIVAQHELDKLGAMERELNAALTQPPDVSMWKPIDSAPKDGTRILALWPYSKTQCWFETFWDDDESQGDKPGWYAPEWGCLLDGYNPTHWQPLPPPPTLQPDHQK